MTHRRRCGWGWGWAHLLEVLLQLLHPLLRRLAFGEDAAIRLMRRHPRRHRRCRRHAGGNMAGVKRSWPWTWLLLLLRRRRLRRRRLRRARLRTRLLLLLLLLPLLCHCRCCRRLRCGWACSRLLGRRLAHQAQKAFLVDELPFVLDSRRHRSAERVGMQVRSAARALARMLGWRHVLRPARGKACRRSRGWGEARRQDSGRSTSFSRSRISACGQVRRESQPTKKKRAESPEY